MVTVASFGILDCVGTLRSNNAIWGTTVLLYIVMETNGKPTITIGKMLFHHTHQGHAATVSRNNDA